MSASRETYYDYMGRRMREDDTNRLKWDHRFMELATMIADWSKDPSSKLVVLLLMMIDEYWPQGTTGFQKVLRILKIV